jgi:hypothetical protein
MTTPIRRVCRNAADLPPPPAIRRVVDDDHHLVLRIDPPPGGSDFDERLVIDRLAPQLPECTVFDSGGAVTIKKVIAEEDVLAGADAIVAAALRFRRTAAGLMDRLSRKLNIPLSAFYGLEYRALLRRGWFRDRWGGRMDSHWRYGFHGRQCGFSNGATGQDVEVETGFGGEFGVLDPSFFGRFVRTTPGLEGVAALVRDNFHDPLRALVILERQGRLTRITDQATGRGRLVAPDP